MELNETNRRMFLFLLVTTVAATGGLQAWMTLINNFAVDKAGLNGLQMGWMQSLREVPGLLALLVIFLLGFVSEHRLAALSIVATGLGIGLTGLFPSFGGLLTTTLLMSFGFHYYETCNMSLGLQYFDRMTAPVVLGRLRGWAAGASLAAAAFIWGMSSFLDYTWLFGVVGVLALAAGLWALTVDPSHASSPPQRRKMIFRKRYWLFYLLTLFGGARRQIFMVFAAFLLVEKFGFSIQTVAALFVLNNAVNMFLNPLIGKAINRFGERSLLTVEYVTLIVVFLVYGYTESPFLAGAAYILDHLVFNFAVAIRTYFQKIADPADIAPSMAVGFTINHVAAVVAPVCGGALWMRDMALPFVLGAALAVVSLALTQMIRTRDLAASSE